MKDPEQAILVRGLKFKFRTPDGDPALAKVHTYYRWADLLEIFLQTDESGKWGAGEEGDQKIFPKPFDSAEEALADLNQRFWKREEWRTQERTKAMTALYGSPPPKVEKEQADSKQTLVLCGLEFQLVPPLSTGTGVEILGLKYVRKTKFGTVILTGSDERGWSARIPLGASTSVMPTARMALEVLIYSLWEEQEVAEHKLRIQRDHLEGLFG